LIRVKEEQKALNKIGNEDREKRRIFGMERGVRIAFILESDSVPFCKFCFKVC
jgi:hypothetical protein